MDASMLADSIAGMVHDVSRGADFRASAFDEVGILSIGDEADLMTIRFVSHIESVGSCMLSDGAFR